MSGFKSPNHTQVPNDFFDMIADMSEAELRVTLVMIRETRGWHRDAAKIGKQEMADKGGLSFNGVTAGCEAARERGTFRRTNQDAKTRAEWELISEDEPSASEGVNPQPVRDEPATTEGQVRLKERVKKTKQIKTSAEKSAKQPTPPEVKLFREVTERFPNKVNYPDVVSIVQSVSKRIGKDCTADDLRPFYAAWCFRDYKPTSLAWLSWAESGIVPPQNGHKPNRRNANLAALAAMDFGD